MAVSQYGTSAATASGIALGGRAITSVCSGTPWWTGIDSASLEGAANLADAYCRANRGDPTWDYEPWSDGYTLHAPVGSFAPNPFGLHDVHGNVQEWCRDSYQETFAETCSQGDGLQENVATTERSIRGGSWFLGPGNCRAAFRTGAVPWHVGINIGLRVARAIDQSR